MNSYDFFIHEFTCFMNSYMNSGVPRFQMLLLSLLHSAALPALVQRRSCSRRFADLCTPPPGRCRPVAGRWAGSVNSGQNGIPTWTEATTLRRCLGVRTGDKRLPGSASHMSGCPPARILPCQLETDLARTRRCVGPGRFVAADSD